MTPANVNDITAAKAMPIEAGATYVYDLGYYDYGWWAELDDAGCRFVTRLKKNTPLTVVHENRVATDQQYPSATASAICRHGSPPAATTRCRRRCAKSG